MSEAIVDSQSQVLEDSEPGVWSQRWERVEAWLASASDRLNPILVKESRQALKSRQFGLTFVLLLILCWVATIGGVALVGPGIYYSAAGAVLLKAYFFVLLFPLAVVVPFTAYRSLTSEREENTYDLLRVSTLSPHQIIRGKLGSAVVQMGVFLSAVAPCIAFTYLLRGVDVVIIAVMLLYATLGSLGLSMLGLFMASLAQKKQGQVLLSVGLVTLLLFCFFGAIALTVAFLDEGSYLLSDSDFWITTMALLSLYLTTFALVYLATVALISYRSENRSTPLRFAMLVQQATFVGWIAFMCTVEGIPPTDVAAAMFLICVVYWYFMGTMLTTEAADLSHRVRRGLPQSTVGRILLGLFNPGPGTGYLFAIANVTAVMAMISLAAIAIDYLPRRNLGSLDFNELTLVMLFAWSYLVFYLGIGRLLIGFARRFVPVIGVAGVLLHVILLGLGSGIPSLLQMSIRTWRNAGYNPLQWSNPFWTFEELTNRSLASSSEVWLQALVLLTLAVCVLVINLPSIARELMQEHVSLPSRVAQDEAELHPVEIKPQNPWEESETET